MMDPKIPSTTITTTTSLPGTFIFKPLQANFLIDRDPEGKMDPYCKIKLGWHKGKSSVAKHEGTHPTWNDVIILKRKHNEEFAKIKVKDKDRKSLNPRIGEAKINLEEIIAKGRVVQKYPLHKKDHLHRKDHMTGEILLAIEYTPIVI